jgi:hypothetical protein
MKHSIRKEDVTYVVRPEQKKVIAYIEDTQWMFTDFVDENYPGSYAFWASESMADKLRMPNKFVGVATCGPDDVWDENVGRLIAFDRMKDNLNKSFFKRANTFVAEMEKRLDIFCDRVNGYGMKLETNMNRRKEIIKKILGEEETTEA